ncbi:ClpP/crotonase [Fistulina hepatica ATCC 64428]|uniref:ClpP/crotonase n=1 Tax=Fistulina hepatica ATCC 64428 TaxID=1128425 RepID=A0A0D7AQS6_9AGAR|nr:ClpP/crotonase [Fistulina hepatica ATCC 64428]
MPVQNHSTEWIRVSEPFPHVFHLELCRPPVNAFSTQFWTEYKDVLEKINLELDARAVVISSKFPKIFTAGIDLADASQFAEFHKLGSDPARVTAYVREHIKEFQYAISTPIRCRFPVIAALHGNVVGLGIDIASACDIRYAASDARFSIKEVDIGLAADIGTLAHLPKITGNASLVRELAYTARSFEAREAEKLGFVSTVVQGGRESVIHAALDLARTIAQKSPVAVFGTKHLLYHAQDHTVAENLEYTSLWNGAALQTQARTFFLKMRVH